MKLKKQVAVSTWLDVIFVLDLLYSKYTINRKPTSNPQVFEVRVHVFMCADTDAVMQGRI